MIQLQAKKRLKFDSTLEAEVFLIWRNSKTYIHISSTVEIEMTNLHKFDELRLDDTFFPMIAAQHIDKSFLFPTFPLFFCYFVDIRFIISFVVCWHWRFDLWNQHSDIRTNPNNLNVWTEANVWIDVQTTLGICPLIIFNASICYTNGIKTFEFGYERAISHQILMINN